MNINLPLLSAEMVAALRLVSLTPAVQAAMFVQTVQVKIAQGLNIEWTVVERWTATIYECATHQINYSNSSFTSGHLGIIYDKLSAGETPDVIESYLQSLKEIYL